MWFESRRNNERGHPPGTAYLTRVGLVVEESSRMDLGIARAFSLTQHGAKTS